jgi:hypothetical protein
MGLIAKLVHLVFAPATWLIKGVAGLFQKKE